MMPGKSGDDISNGSGAIVLTDKQANKVTQTDTTENNAILTVRVVNLNSLQQA